MNFGFVRVAAATPEICVADCDKNSDEIIKLINEADEIGASLVAFPELCVTGYTCGDLFLQKTLLDGAKKALVKIVKATAKLNIIAVMGMPLSAGSNLYNCGVVICKGRVICAIPKVNIPNYSEFYEMRHFAPAGENLSTYTFIEGIGKIELVTKAVFTNDALSDFTFGVEVCEDLWVPCSPSTQLALNGANIIVNLAASNEIIGKPEYRRALIEITSAKLKCGYIFANAGLDESSSDMVFSGTNIIAENGVTIAQAVKYTTGIIYADIDVERISGERRGMTTYSTSENYKKYAFEVGEKNFKISRSFSKTPFVPNNRVDIKKRCDEIVSIQIIGLATRLRHLGIEKIVIGLSDNLNSILALIVTVYAFDSLGIPRSNINALSMHCVNPDIEMLAKAYNLAYKKINIEKVKCKLDNLNLSCENFQKACFSQMLIECAFEKNALIVSAEDLSELALECTACNSGYINIYAVNGCVPKTLVEHMIAYEAEKTINVISELLLNILNKSVTSEFIVSTRNGNSQITKGVSIPYDISDFFLYYFVRYGFAPTKILYLASLSFENVYSPKDIKKWIIVFFKRFFSQQCKRAGMPDCPKVGSVALSPKGDLRIPSDVTVSLWLNELNMDL